jgi:acyl-coenzyme A synthetase/AMP-(fatty) acid ligase
MGFRQTETGSIVVTPFPGAIETKPGSATVPFFGIEPAILDPTTGVVRPLSSPFSFTFTETNTSPTFLYRNSTATTSKAF